MQLSPAVEKAWKTLTAALPADQAMMDLTPSEPKDAAICRAATEAARSLSPLLQSAMYLYVDDLDRAHSIVQVWDSPEAAYWHGIMHRREGDYSNAKYWFKRAGSLPGSLSLDPASLTDRAEQLRKKDDPSELVEAQRQEWLTLFEHCAKESV